MQQHTNTVQNLDSKKRVKEKKQRLPIQCNVHNYFRHFIYRDRLRLKKKISLNQMIEKNRRGYFSSFFDRNEKHRRK